MTTKQIHETHIKIAFFAMLLIMLAAIYVAIPDFYSTVWQLSTSGNMQGTIDYLRSFGVWAVLVRVVAAVSSSFDAVDTTPMISPLATLNVMPRSTSGEFG